LSKSDHHEGHEEHEENSFTIFLVLPSLKIFFVSFVSFVVKALRTWQVVEKCDLSRQVYWKYCNSGEQLDAWQAIKHGTECATLGYECWRGRAHLSRR
jgi:hypothetical protein